jgi:alpha-L-arabinofuranosidase
MFYNAITEKYPNITIFASAYDIDGATPPFNAGGDFHEYALPVTMSSQFTYFDNYTSAHPIMIGEYAVVEYDTPEGLQWNAGAPRAYTPFWYGSVAEAIFLLGAERNSDKVFGAAYAPSFMNWNRWEWIPDMIQYDAYPGHTTLGTTWHVLNLLSGTRNTETLPIHITEGEYGPSYFVAGRNAQTGSHIAKFAVYNATGGDSFTLSFDGVGAGATGNLTYLTAPFNASNPIGGNIVEKHSSTIRAGQNGVFKFDLPEYSVAVLEIGANNAGQGHGYGNPWHRRGWQGYKNWGANRGHKGNWAGGWW